MSAGSDRSNVGRRLSQWRRLMLAFGPSSAKKVALAMSEFAWPEQDDEDAEFVVRHCTHKILCKLCDYKTPRGLMTQIEKLEAAGWIERDSYQQTGPGIHREYVLLIPDSVPGDAITELGSPSAGMWKRVLEVNTERTGEIQCTRSEHDEPTAVDALYKNQVNCISEKPVSGELESNIRCTGIPYQVNSDAPLKESLSSSLGDYRKDKGGAAEPAPLDSLISGNEEKTGKRNLNGAAHILDAIADSGLTERVRQERKARLPIGTADYRRNAIIRLAKKGYATKQIAEMSGSSPADVSAVLSEPAA